MRKWLLSTEDGRLASDILRRNAPNQNAAPILDDDRFTSWDDIVAEYRGGVMLASSCREARGVFDLAKGATSNMTLPGVTSAKWSNFFSAPIGYVLRRQIQTCDPNYWNEPINTYREALANPNWCRVPRAVIQGKLNDLLPKGKQIVTP